jgi:hypothetical protein
METRSGHYPLTHGADTRVCRAPTHGGAWLRTAIAILFSAVGLLGQNAPASSWKPLKFLIGTWQAKTQAGTSGAASSGTYTFQLELRDHVLARHSSNSGCKGPADFNCEHGDLLYVYPDTSPMSYKAIYFDNEGHIIQYEVSAPAPGTAVFLSSPSQAGPQYRLDYQLKGSTMFGKFQIRMPGQAEFKSYLEWSGEKKK